MSWFRRPKGQPELPAIEQFMAERRQVMNAEMERKGLELPDPADLLPADWPALPDAYKRALYCEAWADLGANIAYLNDRARMPEWEQPPLPLADFYGQFTGGAGWCAPSEPDYSVT